MAKLVLHFDGRNTVFLADKCSRISVEEALNTYIAGLVWSDPVFDSPVNPEMIPPLSKEPHSTGSSAYQGDSSHNDIDLEKWSAEPLLPQSWTASPASPSLTPPTPGSWSVYKILEKKLVKVPADRGLLRKRLGCFTQTVEGENFAPLFHEHIESLQWPNAGDDLEIQKLTVAGKDKKRYHYLLPAFLELLRWLADDWEGDFAVIIRTYGRDIPFILEGIAIFLQDKHPTIRAPRKRKIPISFDQSYLTRQDDAPRFVYKNAAGEVLAQTDRQIYNFWSQANGIFGVVDDFPYSQQHGYHYTAAKPLFFDRNDSHVQHIIFDDNIRFELDGTNVVEMRSLEGTSESSVGLTDSEAIEFCQHLYVQANLLKVISDQKYFVNEVGKRLHS